MRICSEYYKCALKHNTPHCDGIHAYTVGCDFHCSVSHKVCAKIDSHCGNCGKKDWCKAFEGIGANRDCLDWIAESDKEIRKLISTAKSSANRKSREQAYKDCGLVKVKGALGGTYWE
jgi:hypothetical protein